MFMYIFKYHPDNAIYIKGVCKCAYAEFMEQNPNFPLIQGQFLEYRNDGLDLINNEGHHVGVNVADYQDLITAINNYV